MQHHLEVHAFALMTNHIHLIVTPSSKDSVSATMQALGTRYVQFFNKTYVRTGGLFEGRYRATIVDSQSYWYNCMRYVELNPVRAGLVDQPATYAWSSYAAHALGSPNALLAEHPLYLDLGKTAADRQRGWRAICERPLADDELTEIRQAVHRGGILGKLVLRDPE